MEITSQKILLLEIVKVVNSEFADLSEFVGDAVNLKMKFLGTVCIWVNRVCFDNIVITKAE